MDEIRSHNRQSWDEQVRQGNRWTIPVTSGEISAARQGSWQVVLTPSKPVPSAWFPPLPGCRVLCLASGGGQQAPIFAAAGAAVTVLDNSPLQLEQDLRVAARDNLAIQTVEGDMRDLSPFADESYDLIFHPVSNVFIPDVRPVWREAYRVLRSGGILMAGLVNPILFSFDIRLVDQGIFQLKYPLPFSSITSLDEEEKKYWDRQDDLFEFSHTLQDLLGEQLRAGFHLVDFFEDAEPQEPVSRFFSPYLATRAVKP